MKICSIDGSCTLSIERSGDSREYSGFKVEVQVDIGHGQFSARNNDVQFLNLREFVSTLDKFILERDQTPRLDATYDTYLAFSATGLAVIARYQIGDAFVGRKTAHFRQSGEFEVAQDNLLQYLASARALS